MFLKLFDSVHITEGINRSIIFDTNTRFIQFIPNSLSKLLNNDKQNYTILKESLNPDLQTTIDQYIKFIIDNRLGFIVKRKEDLTAFQKSRSYEKEISKVDYLIWDIKSNNDFNISVIDQIKNIQLKYIQIRLVEELEIDEIIQIFSKLDLFNGTTVNEISIVVKYNQDLETCIIDGKIVQSNIYLQFLFHSCFFEREENYANIQVIKTKTKVNIPLSCGIVTLKNMNLNRSFYLESLNHNSCLYKKISIDLDGNIKNCPSMRQSFGNIKDTAIENALDHLEFQKYWNITKDLVEVCKVCEFRNVCTDCRAYTELTHGSTDLDVSKPLKCGYSPYTTEWEEWSKNPLKQKAIKQYKMQ